MSIIFTKLAMFSRFSTAKMSMLLKDLSDCQNSTKRGPFAYNFTKLAMFSNFSTAKMGMLLADLSECQNSTKKGPFAYNFYEAYNNFQFFNSEDGHVTRRSF